MKSKGWDTVCNICSAGTSVVCMGSMGAAAVAAGAAGATSVAGMAEMGSMATMADSTAPQAATAVPFLTSLLEQIGLGFLNQVPDSVLRPIFIVLLLLSVGTAYVSFRTHRRPHTILLTALSGAVLYTSIYIWMNELLYYVGLAGMLGAAVWGLVLAKSAVGAVPGKVEGSKEGSSGASSVSKRRWLLLAGVLLFLAFGGYVGRSLTSSPGGPAPEGSAAHDGFSAPDFKVATAAGDFGLSQQRGKGIILVFSSAGCTSCGPKLTALAQLYREYRGKGLEVLVRDVATSDTQETFVAYLTQWQASDLAWAVDVEYRVTLAYGVRSLGTVIGIGREGGIVYNNAAAVPEPYEAMRKAVETTLQ